jgi:hypothetical protein
MSYYKEINSKPYRRIASWRKESPAIKYANRINTSITPVRIYGAIVEHEKGWYSVYARYK